LNLRQKRQAIGKGLTMTEQDLELKRQKMLASKARAQAIVQARSHRTEEGTVLSMPDFNDSEISKIFLQAMNDAHEYFSAATHLGHATTYRKSDE
jgi:hypothetical protein